MSAAVLGASGYSGGELLRLLEGHPLVSVEIAAAGGRAGEDLGSVHPHLATLDIGPLTGAEAALEADVDVLFSCLPSGASAGLLGRALAATIVDLGDDHRADDGWVYGLTEYARGEVKERVANPGCYPTASLLGLLPFAATGAIEGPVVIDAMSGVSGAGRAASDHLMFAHVAGGAAAYGTTEHRHIAEIERGLARFASFETSVSFTPHLVPMARGLLVTARARLTGNLTDEQALGILADRYSDELFVQVTREWPSTKAVTGTNRALVHARVDRRNSLLVCSAAVDNLGKGAAGQALQNANLALGLDEELGLEGLASWP